MFNRLVKRTVDANGPDPDGSIDQFFAGYDGINPTLEFSKANPGAGGVGIADLKHRYLWGPMVDQLFADEQLSSPTVAGNTLFPIADHLGTIRDIADFNGTTGLFFLADHRIFDSYGNLTAVPVVELNFAFTGKFLDDQTGYSLHWNRWLDPKTGKWLSEDPMGFQSGDGFNFTAYAQNDAVNFVDSNGLDRRKVGDYVVTGKGHHIIPVELWDQFGFDSEVYEWLDKQVLSSQSHRNSAHGAKTGYSGFLGAELTERLSEHLADNPDKTLAVSEQMVFLQEFVDDVKNGRVKRQFIKEFNDVVPKGIDEVNKWRNSPGGRGKFPAEADVVPKTKIAGLRPLQAGKAEEIAKRLGAPTNSSWLGFGARKLAPKVIVFAAAISIYNTARAEGNSPAEALLIAGLEGVNPFPVGYEEWTAAGNAYSNAITRAKENNFLGPYGVPKTDNYGYPEGHWLLRAPELKRPSGQ